MSKDAALDAISHKKFVFFVIPVYSASTETLGGVSTVDDNVNSLDSNAHLFSFISSNNQGTSFL